MSIGIPAIGLTVTVVYFYLAVKALTGLAVNF